MSANASVTSRDLINALDRLTPETVPSWGRLTAPGMVRHVNQTIDLHRGLIKAPLYLRILGRVFTGPFIRKVLSQPYAVFSGSSPGLIYRSSSSLYCWSCRLR